MQELASATFERLTKRNAESSSFIVLYRRDGENSERPEKLMCWFACCCLGALFEGIYILECYGGVPKLGVSIEGFSE